MSNVTVINPDVRFATSYTSIENEKAAVKHEVLMDKIGGEIFIKRPLDGRVISFSQNNKYLYEILVELKILLKNYTNITYPLTDESFFVSMDYIMRYINNTSLEILMGDDINLNTTSLDPNKKLNFPLSKDSNGFFCMLKPRWVDKAIIEYLTNQYNLLCKDYNGTNESILIEKSKFMESGYETSNATIFYTITMNGLTSSQEKKMIQIDGNSHIKIGETCVVPFPTSYNSYLEKIETIEITVNRVTFDKIHFIDNYINSDSNFDHTIYNKLIAPDNRIDIPVINIFSFVDDASKIQNEISRQLILLMDTPSLHNYLGILDKLSVGNGVIVQPTRPLDSLWTINNAWAETIRTVKYAGVVQKEDCETDIDLLESLIYNVDGIITGFSLDENETNMFFIQRIANGVG